MHGVEGINGFVDVIASWPPLLVPAANVGAVGMHLSQGKDGVGVRGGTCLLNAGRAHTKQAGGSQCTAYALPALGSGQRTRLVAEKGRRLGRVSDTCNV